MHDSSGTAVVVEPSFWQQDINRDVRFRISYWKEEAIGFSLLLNLKVNSAPSVISE